METPRILAVGSQEASVKPILSYLATFPGEITWVRDSEEALHRLKEDPYDLVLLDAVMPGQSGIEVLRGIKQEEKTRLLPVLMLTSPEDKQTRLEAVAAGAEDVLKKPVDNLELQLRVRSLLRLKGLTDQLEDLEGIVFSFATALDARDRYTCGHSERTSILAANLAKAVGLPEGECETVRKGTFLHDIGKIGVPDAILLKPGPLDARERRIMNLHPVMGYNICAPLKSFTTFLPIIRHHHERLDGSGYPDGLKGEDVPLHCRIASLVEVYDAMTSERPYRGALDKQEAFTIIRREVKRGWWDGELAERLFEMVA